MRHPLSDVDPYGRIGFKIAQLLRHAQVMDVLPAATDRSYTEWHLLKRKRQFGTGQSRSKHAFSRSKAGVSESLLTVFEPENASLGLK